MSACVTVCVCMCVCVCVCLGMSVCDVCVHVCACAPGAYARIDMPLVHTLCQVLRDDLPEHTFQSPSPTITPDRVLPSDLRHAFGQENDVHLDHQNHARELATSTEYIVRGYDPQPYTQTLRPHDCTASPWSISKSEVLNNQLM